jgi:hypothetical protein
MTHPILDKYVTFLRDIIRARFEAQADHAGPREFGPAADYEDFIGWDDGYTLNRATLMTAPPVWSDAAGARVRPVVLIAIGSDSQPHNPHDKWPVVPPFVGGPSDPAGVTVGEASGGGLARALMARLGGANLRQWDNGWVSFTVTLPDEPPWVPG